MLLGPKIWKKNMRKKIDHNFFENFYCNNCWFCDQAFVQFISDYFENLLNINNFVRKKLIKAWSNA